MTARVTHMNVRIYKYDVQFFQIGKKCSVLEIEEEFCP